MSIRPRSWNAASELLGNLALAGAASLVGGVLVEGASRALARIHERDTIERLQDRARPAAGSRVPLGRLLRPSSHPRIVYELHPDLDVVFTPGGGPAVRVRTNASGFRSPARAPGKPAGTTRIVGIGDSIMFGWGVEASETYLTRLEASLDDALPDSRWEAVNTAVPGYNTAMEVETLVQKGLRYAPDWVVVGFVPNDASLPNFIRQRSDVWALDRSFLFDLATGRGAFAPVVGDGLLPAPRRADDRAFEDDPRRVPAPYRPLAGWRALEAAMRELALLSRAHRFEVVVIAFVPGDDDPRKRRGLEAARRAGLPVIDLGPEQQAYLEARGGVPYLGSALTVSATDPHPSPLAHEMAARALHRFISEGRAALRPGETDAPERPGP